MVRDAVGHRPQEEALGTGAPAVAVIACLIAGFGLLTVAEGSLPHALGVVALLAFVVTGFASAVPALVS